MWLLQFDLQLIFPLCFSCSLLQRQPSGIRASLEPDSSNANTTNCHSLIAPGLLLQLQQRLFIKQADILYVLMVNAEIYVLSAEIWVIFLLLLGFFIMPQQSTSRHTDPRTKAAVRDIKYTFAFWYRGEISDSKPFRLKGIVFTFNTSRSL